jgi:polyisoprenoid-binding protein YceI
MKTIFFLLAALVLSGAVIAQKYSTRNGTVSFYSKTSLEDIKASNSQVYAVIDAGNKNMAFQLLMKGFLFAKELMQEHFNENYVESDKYPKASFTGSYTGDVNTAKEGTYNVTVKGQLTMHGVTKPVEAPATIQVQGGKLVGKCTFPVPLADYNINIPSMVKDKIAKQIEITVLADCSAAQ